MLKYSKKEILLKKWGKFTSTKKYVTVKGIQNYRFENENFVSLGRLGKVVPFNKIQLERVPIGHAISRKKKNDVNKLLIKIFDKNWADEPVADELRWYKYIIFYVPATYTEEPEDECDCLDQERCDLHI